MLHIVNILQYPVRIQYIQYQYVAVGGSTWAEGLASPIRSLPRSLDRLDVLDAWLPASALAGAAVPPGAGMAAFWQLAAGHPVALQVARLWALREAHLRLLANILARDHIVFNILNILGQYIGSIYWPMPRTPE